MKFNLENKDKNNEVFKNKKNNEIFGNKDNSNEIFNNKEKNDIFLKNKEINKDGTSLKEKTENGFEDCFFNDKKSINNEEIKSEVDDHNIDIFDDCKIDKKEYEKNSSFYLENDIKVNTYDDIQKKTYDDIQKKTYDDIQKKTYDDIEKKTYDDMKKNIYDDIKENYYDNSDFDDCGKEIEEDESYKDCLSLKELDEIKADLEKTYNNGRDVWSKLGIKQLDNYKEHNDIYNGHIEKVRLKTLQAADALEEHFKHNDYNGIFSSKLDRKTLEFMSLYHDTGMDGNIDTKNYEKEHQAYLSDKSIRKKYIDDTIQKKKNKLKRDGIELDDIGLEKERIKANEKFEKEAFENHFRTNHSLESAIHVLRDREKIEKYNVNADEVALGCLCHSKSFSGVENISSEDEWKYAINRIEDRVFEFNKSHPDEKIHFDKSFIINDDGSLKKEKLKEIRSEVIALRIGDSSGHDTNSRVSQSGKSIEFSLKEKFEKDVLPVDFEERNRRGEYSNYFYEVQTADVKVGGVEINNESDPNGISRAYAVGEGNFKSLDCNTDKDGNLIETIELCDGNAFPLSTQFCIDQRIQEFKTAKPLKYKFLIKLGDNCSDEAYKSYLKFADDIESDAVVEVEK